MPLNADYKFMNAQAKYEEAKTSAEKLEGLREMLRTAPSHKGAETLRAGIKTKIKKLLEENAKQKKGGGHDPFSVKKEVDFAVALIGKTNVGKSWLLNKITNSKTEIGNWDYTTVVPVSGIMNYGGAKVQIIEVPSFMDARSRGVARSADAVAYIINDEKEIKELETFLRAGNVKRPTTLIKLKTGEENLAYIKKQLFNVTGAIRVFTKPPGGKPVMNEAFLLKKGSTVRQACGKIHKDFVNKLKFAKVWGSSKFQGQKVGVNYKLKDEDIIELHV